jgi:hypothetical protein
MKRKISLLVILGLVLAIVQNPKVAKSTTVNGPCAVAAYTPVDRGYAITGDAVISCSVSVPVQLVVELQQVIGSSVFTVDQISATGIGWGSLRVSKSCSFRNLTYTYRTVAYGYFNYGGYTYRVPINGVDTSLLAYLKCL